MTSKRRGSSRAKSEQDSAVGITHSVTLRVECFYAPPVFHIPNTTDLREDTGEDGRKRTFVCWSQANSTAIQGDVRHCFEDILRLAHAKPEEVQSFVRQWGPLGRFIREGKEAMLEERVYHYQKFAVRLHAFLNLIRDLHNGQTGDQTDWETAISALSKSKRFPADFSTAPNFSVEAARVQLARIVTTLLAEIPIRPVLTWETHPPQLVLRKSKVVTRKSKDEPLTADTDVVYGCYSALVMVLVELCLVPPSFVRCSICQKYIRIEGRRGRKDSKHYCSVECQKQANRNLSAARQREKRRQQEATGGLEQEARAHE